MEAINQMSEPRVFDFHNTMTGTPTPSFKITDFDTGTISRTIAYYRLICCDVFDDKGNAELNRYLTVEEIQDLRKKGLDVFVNPRVEPAWGASITWSISTHNESTYNGRICPTCGYKDYDDAFVIMKCGSCGTLYDATKAKECLIDD